MKSCPYCAWSNPADARFCAGCGKLIIDGEEREQTQLASSPQQTRQSSSLSPSIASSSPPETPALQSESAQPAKMTLVPDINVPASPGINQPVASVPGTPQVSSVASVPGAPGQMSSIAGSLGSKVTGGILTTIWGKVVAGALVVVVAATVATRVYPTIPNLPGNTSQSQTQGTTHNAPGQKTPTTDEKTEAVPPTETNCPPNGQARAAVTAPLKMGTQNTLIYRSGRDATGHITLARYNSVTRTSATLVTASSNEAIVDAQVSADGKWVLFQRIDPGYVGNGRFAPPVASKLQMVRIDGQGLQTLYCATATSIYTLDNLMAPYYSPLKWSPDRTYVAFTQAPEGGAEAPYDLYILNLKTGKVQKALTSSYLPLRWLDDTHLYLRHTQGNASELLLFDINKPASQALSQVIPASELGDCWDISLNQAHNRLYTSKCTNQENASVPSTITERPVTGGAATTIYSTSTTQIMGFTPAPYFQFFETYQSGTPYSSKLWRVSANNTMTSINPDTGTQSLCWQGQSTRDSKLFAFITEDNNGNDFLRFGAANGGPYTEVSRDTPLPEPILFSTPQVIGWTLF